MIATDEGRERFWCERCDQVGSLVTMAFAEGGSGTVAVCRAEEPRLFEFDYFGYRTTVLLDEDTEGGTKLTLTSQDRDHETLAGWVSVLLSLKAAADHGVDLRNHEGRPLVEAPLRRQLSPVNHPASTPARQPRCTPCATRPAVTLRRIRRTGVQNKTSGPGGAAKLGCRIW
jgi:hypothetical protein